MHKDFSFCDKTIRPEENNTRQWILREIIHFNAK